MDALLFALFLAAIQQCFAESTITKYTNSLSLPTPSSLSSQPNDPFLYPSHELGAVIVEHQQPGSLPLPPLLPFLLSCAQSLDKLERASHLDLHKPIPGGYFWRGEDEHGFRFMMRRVDSNQLLFWHVYRVIEVLKIWARQWGTRGWKTAEVRYLNHDGVQVGKGLIGSKGFEEDESG
ncbi:MAG: hypothetical protein Q9167_008143 [Letrouitia subvulpina]